MPRQAARHAVLYGTAAVVLAADQLSKYLVVRGLAGRPPLRLVGSFVELRYTTNSGGAFSLLTGAPLFFAVMAVVIIGGIVYASRRTQGLPVLLAFLLGRSERAGRQPGQTAADAGPRAPDPS